MKYLKKYKAYFENDEATLDRKDSDEPDVELAKDKLEELKLHLKEYNSKKSNVENIYSDSTKSSEDIESEIDSLLGSDNDNYFLKQLLSIERKKWQITKLEDDIIKDDMKIDEYNNTESEDVDSIKQKIAEIEQRKNEKVDKINELESDIGDLEEKHKETIDKKKEELEEWILKIQ